MLLLEVTCTKKDAAGMFLAPQMQVHASLTRAKLSCPAKSFTHTVVRTEVKTFKVIYLVEVNFDK